MANEEPKGKTEEKGEKSSKSGPKAILEQIAQAVNKQSKLVQIEVQETNDKVPVGVVKVDLPAGEKFIDYDSLNSGKISFISQKLSDTVGAEAQKLGWGVTWHPDVWAFELSMSSGSETKEEVVESEGGKEEGQQEEKKEPGFVEKGSLETNLG